MCATLPLVATAKMPKAASAWLVRYLLDEEAGRADAFRAFLREVSRGGGVAAGDLETALGRSWPELEAGWRRFVVERAIAGGVAAPQTESAVGAASSENTARTPPGAAAVPSAALADAS